MINKYLDKEKYCYYTVEIENNIFYFLPQNDKIFMFLLINDIGIIKRIPSILASISTQHSRLKIIKELSNSEAVEDFDIRSFLWDLYLVIIYECDENNIIASQIVNRIERDRFVARKLILQGNLLCISSELNNLLRGKDKLQAILQETEVVFNPDQEYLVSDIIKTSNVEINDSIIGEIFSGKSRALNVIDEYLENLKSKDYNKNEDRRN